MVSRFKRRAEVQAVRRQSENVDLSGNKWQKADEDRHNEELHEMRDEKCNQKFCRET